MACYKNILIWHILIWHIIYILYYTYVNIYNIVCCQVPHPPGAGAQPRAGEVGRGRLPLPTLHWGGGDNLDHLR